MCLIPFKFRQSQVARMHPSLHALRTPDKPAYIMGSNGESVSYSELDRRSNQGARLFRRLDLQVGDSVAFLIENNAWFFETVWAAQRAGLYYTCLSTRLTAKEAAYILQDSGARILVASVTVGPAADELPKLLPSLTFASVGGSRAGFIDFGAARAEMSETPVPDERPGQDMLYSSGTTGRPKGVMPALPDRTDLAQHTHVSLLCEQLYGFDSGTIYLSVGPLYHAAPLRFSMAAQKLGGTVIVMQKFDAEDALRLIERYRVTHSQWVPTHFVRLLKHRSEAGDRYDRSSLRVAIHTAAPCPMHVKQAMINWWGPIIYEYYGATEGIGACAISSHEWLTHKGSVGRAVLGEVRICDDHGEPLPPRTEGLIYFANARPFVYHNDPDKTEENRNRYGWITIGDVGHVDEDGYLYLTDRRSFMIISGGVNIYPQEVENALMEHPAVQDAAVIGAPDDDMGERVVAVVQPTEGVKPGPSLAADIEAFLRTRISGVKMPRQFDFRTALPREPTGKLLKHLLHEEYRASYKRPG
jgi:long-chain acyl-CoA synthetase